MIHPQLVSHIQTRLAQGASLEAIKNSILAAGGWSEADITEAFTQVAQIASAPIMPPAPSSSPVVASSIPSSISSSTNTLPPKRTKNIAMLSIGAIALLALIGGGVYAYKQGIGPFSTSLYTEDVFISALLRKSSEINSASYRILASLDVSPRESDAKAFNVQFTDEKDRKARYINDANRARHAETILSLFSYDATYGKKEYPPYPPLSVLISKYKSGRFYSEGGSPAISDTDPGTGARYKYEVLEGGKKFALTITFETDNAIKTIRASKGYSATSTPINGHTVTFTQDTRVPYSYYIYNQAPEPLLVSLSKNAAYLPAELAFNLSAGAKMNLEKQEWLFNVNAAGDFGDLTYKVNVDALKKKAGYYLRINNMPNIFFLNDLAQSKGQWVNLSISSTTSRYSTLGYIAEEIPRLETRYKEDRQEHIALLRKIADIGDEEKLFKFKSVPHKEVIEGKMLYRYELSVRKEAILPFYKRLLVESQTNPDLAQNTLFQDQGMVDYLSSPEFDQVYEYLDRNTFVTLWVDGQGFPAVLEYKMRIVPPDTAEKLKDKQFNLTLRLVLDDVNKSVDIETPKDSKMIDEIFGLD